MPGARVSTLPFSQPFGRMVILRSCDGVRFFKSVIPSAICRFKFTVSWLVKPVDTFRPATSSISYPALRWPHRRGGTGNHNTTKIDAVSIASRALVDGARMGAAIGPKGAGVRAQCSPIFYFLGAEVPAWEQCHPSSICFDTWFSCKLRPV